MGRRRVLLPVKSVARWIADLLKSCGYSTAVAESVAEEWGLEEWSSTMTKNSKPMLPLRVEALLAVSPSLLHVQVSARADALQIRAPFGDLTIPYALITGVARDAHDRIRLNLAGATLLLDLPNLPDMAINYLLDLLERGDARGTVIDTGKTQHGHPR